MLKILVTGANGYVGSHVVKYLTTYTPHKIIAVDFENTFISPKAHFIKQDILKNCTDSHLYDLFQAPNILIHLAWQDGFKHNALSHLENLPKHFTFIKNMLDHGTHNITIMGSMHEVGYFEGQISDVHPPATRPMSLYAIAKNSLRQALFALCINNPQISLKWLRGFYIMGDDIRSQSIFSKIIQWEKEGKKTFPFTDGLAKYDFIDIETLAKMIVAASLYQQTNTPEIINICSGTAISLKEKVEEFLTTHHFHIRPLYGSFPKRPYDSAIIYGSAEKIHHILELHHAQVDQ